MSDCGALRQLFRKLGDNSGQATVEAAFMVPLFLTGILLLAQPGIILYDRMVMEEAAAEGCRALATCPAGAEDQCRAYILRRLASIPSQDLFHIHNAGCSWKIDLTGNDSTLSTTVSIENKLMPLPLIGLGAGFLGLLGDDGSFSLTVEESLQMQPSWVEGTKYSEGPAAWIGSWNHD